jgi:hypothetical protein
MTRTSQLIVGTLLALDFTVAAAQAQTARAWVSGNGTDQAGCGLVTSPCRTPQYAHDHIINAGGEIDILDPAGYGSLAITKAISIVNDGVGTAGILSPASGNAITIAAGSGNVQLRGLTIEGSGTGYNGIIFNSGDSLTVTNCVIQNFTHVGAGTGNGILLQPTASMSFVISNTIISNNGDTGVFYIPPSGSPAVNGVLDHVVMTGNEYGLDLSVGFASGTTQVAISNSIASNNGLYGFFFTNDGSGAPLTVSIDNTGVSGNGLNGIYADTTTKVLLGRSVVTENATGIMNGTSPNTFYTYKDNRINLNTTDFGSLGLTTLTLN